MESEFAKFHPIVNFIYFALVMLIVMLTLNPWILLIAWISSFIYGIMLRGVSFLKRNIMMEIPILIFIIGIQPLFSHNGTTVLFYINYNSVTAEGFVYGAVVGLLLITMIQWCSCMSEIMSSEKIVFLFGRLIPTIGLIFSMILRFVPLLRQRYRMIHEGQLGMGRTAKEMGIVKRTKQYIKEISILISWSLEASIETSSSMESRGYGLKGRTSYHLYKLNKSDIIISAIICAIGAACLSSIITGKLSTYYFPIIYVPKLNVMSMLSLISFAVIAVFPIACELKNGELNGNNRI